MKRILIAVLSCPNGVYPMLMNAQMDTWDSEPVDGVQSFYYMGRPHGPWLHFADPRMGFFEVDEDYTMIGHKNLLAFKHALDHFDFDYMARVNASCYVSKGNLFRYCQDLQDEGLFIGMVTEDSKKRPFVIGGGQYIISRDVVQLITDHGGLWDHGEAEDFAMSKIVSDLGIPWSGPGKHCCVERRNGKWNCLVRNSPTDDYRSDMSDLSEMKQVTGHHFFRVNQSPNRDMDVFVMKELKKAGL